MIITFRDTADAIMIGDDIRITITAVTGNEVQLRIEAPDGMEIQQEERYLAKLANRIEVHEN